MLLLLPGSAGLWITHTFALQSVVRMWESRGSQSLAVLAGVCFSQLQQYRCLQVVLDAHYQAMDILRRLSQNLK